MEKCTGCSVPRKISDMRHSMMTAAMAGALVWSTGAVFNLSAQAPSADAATAKPAPRMAAGPPAARGGAPGGGGPPAQPPVTFSSLYQPWAAAHAKTLADKNDPTVHCL